VDNALNARLSHAFELIEAYCGKTVRKQGPIILVCAERAIQLACRRHGVTLDELLESIRALRGIEPRLQRFELADGRAGIQITAAGR
jgi:hypothetical protein